MRLSKKFKISLLAIVGATVLSGCSGGGNSTSNNSNNSETSIVPPADGDIKNNITEEEISPYKSSPITLSFWSPIVGPDAGYFQNIITGWNDLYGNYIKIQSDPIEEEAHYTRILTSFSDNSTADISLIHKSRISRYERMGKLRDMTSIVSQAGLEKSQYLEGAWDAGIFDDKMYGLTLDYFPTLLFYNKKLIPEGYSEADILSEDFTYEKMCEMMKSAYVYNRVSSKRKYGFAFNYGYCEKPYIANVYGVGGKPVDDNNPTEPLYNDAKSFRAVKAIESIPFTFDSEGHKVASESGSDHRKVFNSGRALFTMDGIYSASSLVYHNDTVDTGIAFLPKVDSSASTSTYSDMHMFATFTNKNNSTVRDTAIALFIKFFVNNTSYWCKSGKVAATVEAANDADYKNLEWAFVSDSFSSLVTPGKAYSFQTIVSHAAETISEICEGKSDGSRFSDAEIQSKLDKSVEEAKNLVKQL